MPREVRSPRRRCRQGQFLVRPVREKGSRLSQLRGLAGPLWPLPARKNHRLDPGLHLHLVVLLGARFCPDLPLLKSSTLLQYNCLNGPPLQGSYLQRVAF